MYTTVIELDPPNHNRDGLLVLNSVMVVCMDHLGKCTYTNELETSRTFGKEVRRVPLK